MLSKAISITAKAFEGKKDKGGSPYILHCLRVMNAVNQKDHELMCIAVMHDTVEDCEDITMEILAQMGFSLRVLRAVDLLTHDRENTSYDDYIKAISTNKDAVAVKLADLKDNSDISRLK